MGNPKKIPKLSFKWTLSKNKKNRSLFGLVVRLRIFRLWRVKSNVYVLWPLAKRSKLNSRPVYCSRLYEICNKNRPNQQHFQPLSATVVLITKWYRAGNTTIDFSFFDRKPPQQVSGRCLRGLWLLQTREHKENPYFYSKLITETGSHTFMYGFCLYKKELDSVFLFYFLSIPSFPIVLALRWAVRLWNFQESGS